MKKKRTIIILIASSLLILAFTLPISIYYINLRPDPRNIFDEIYLETEKTYRNNNILKNIKGLDIKGYWPDDSEYLKNIPHGSYKEHYYSDGYNNIALGFDFTNSEQTSYIRFDKHIDTLIRIRIRAKYNYLEKKLQKSIKIILEKGGSDDYIEEESQVKAYLQKYDITTDDLDHYYDEIVNKKVLPDWCSIYDSKFSPNNYGDIIIKTQWKDW
ncbi:MAG: TipC family immunity protein [Streptococcus sp.]|nr:TipC family immunity protein [Streptococcus sp.]